MTLPKRPPLNQPIPNADIPNIPRQYSVKAPYWDAVLSGDLVVRDDGALAIEGSSTPPVGDVEVQGEYWSMPLGNGLGLWRGELRTLEPEFPPYGCRTDVITSGVTDFTDAWRDCTFSSFPNNIDTSAGVTFDSAWYNCSNLKNFPFLGTSSGTNFNSAWEDCTDLTIFPSIDTSSGIQFSNTWKGCSSLASFPLLDVSSGTNFDYAWFGCSFLSTFPLLDVSQGTSFSHAWEFCILLGNFPALDVSNGEVFNAAWSSCANLYSFPALDFSSGMDFTYAWTFCLDLENFPANVFDNCPSINFYGAWYNCALSQQSVDNILVSLNTAGHSDGTVSLDGGTSAAPSATGLAAKASLQARGWTVLTN